MLFKFLKFIIVGFSGMVIDFSVTFLLKEKIKVNRYLANCAGFITAASTNYLVNRIWTFNSHNPHVINEFGLFMLISLIGLGINNLFLYLFEKKAPFYVSKFLAIIITSLWNFGANYYFNFGR